MGAWYSSRFMPTVVAPKSTVMMPNDERNTALGAKFQARPTRGWKLLRSFLPSCAVGWVIAPIFPVSGSATVGLNSDCWFHLVCIGDSYDQRIPRSNVSLRAGFHSSCTYHACCHQYGSQEAKFFV